MLERISIELTNQCNKACWFCYNTSQPHGPTSWTVEEVDRLVRDCAVNGVRAVSFGGGEPLQFSGLFDLLTLLDGILFRSITTNGQRLDGELLERLCTARPDKVHISIHFPNHTTEVDRVIAQVQTLAGRGIKSGVNLLVARSKLAAARIAADSLHAAGIGNDRIVYLPMRGQDTPTPSEVAALSLGQPFQSMSCLSGCARSPRFASIAWDRKVAWCSYTKSRRVLPDLTYLGICRALFALPLTFCGGTTEAAV
jgi:sulfatase maturation enzyme AslB (radical SAM superfamily)